MDCNHRVNKKLRIENGKTRSPDREPNTCIPNGDISNLRMRQSCLGTSDRCMIHNAVIDRLAIGYYEQNIAAGLPLYARLLMNPRPGNSPPQTNTPCMSTTYHAPVPVLRDVLSFHFKIGDLIEEAMVHQQEST